MNSKLYILLLLFLCSCKKPIQSKSVIELEDEQTQNSPEIDPCNYHGFYEYPGNKYFDTIRIGGNWYIDPIDDSVGFKKTDFGFLKKENKIYKKSKEDRYCNGVMIQIEYYQDYSGQIELSSYKDYDDVFFTSMETVYFWWPNSEGNWLHPISEADPKTFEPFKNICGGKDKNGVFYGCPNYGVYQLNIPQTSSFEFVAKEDNYWNSPSHFILIDHKVYDVKFDIIKGYYCELDKSITVNQVLEMKK